MDAAEYYAARIDALSAQQEQLRGRAGATPDWDAMAGNFRADPRRPLDPNLEIVAAYVAPKDVLVDVGGGAGRLSLPLALRCREVINVDPSPGMLRAFAESALEAGITNARGVEAEWMEADEPRGDLVLVANVTYFVREIVPFIEKLVATARRRVIILVWSVPPPSQDAPLFRVLHGYEQVAHPSHRELLPVLWEMGILPDVRVLPAATRRATVQMPHTRDEAIQFALRRFPEVEPERGGAVVEAQFAALFEAREGRYWPRWLPAARELLITWERAI